MQTARTPKKILITGVAGMIGSHLLDELIKTCHVIGVDNLSFGRRGNIAAHLTNPDFVFHEMDVSSFEGLKEIADGVQVIIHLAARKKIAEADSLIPTIESNCKGTENIFEVARAVGAKVIFASSSDVYGMSNDLPLCEDGDLTIGPNMIKRWSYAVSKLYGEQLAYAYYHDYGVPVVILRYFGAFSPRSSFSWSGGHIPIFIKAAMENSEMIIHGDGRQTRSMGFVSDLVNGTILAMEKPEAVGEIINIGNDEEMSVLDTAYLIHQLVNAGSPIKLKFMPMSEVFGRYKDIMRRVPDLSKAKRILGYSPQVDLKKAICLTIDHLSAK